MISLVVLLAWLITDLVATYGVFHYRRRLAPLTPATDSPQVVIIVAIKGVSELTPKFLEALCHQDYRAYRLLCAVESPSDPAAALLESVRSGLGAKISLEVVIAGIAVNRTQKVHNLLAALHALRDDDRIVAFADADILPGPRGSRSSSDPLRIERPPPAPAIVGSCRPIGAGQASSWPLPTCPSPLPRAPGAGTYVGAAPPRSNDGRSIESIYRRFGSARRRTI